MMLMPFVFGPPDEPQKCRPEVDGLYIRGTRHHLEANTLKVLALLIEARPRLLSNRAIAEGVHGDAWHINENQFARGYVSKINKALGDFGTREK